MEPLRGGSLASLSEEDSAALHRLRPEEGIPAWAFRFLQSLPNVVVTLSGMSNFDQMRDNIRTFAEEKPLSAEETDALLSIAESGYSYAAGLI